MALIFYSENDPFESWRDALNAALPDLEVRPWDAPGDPTDIEFALVWRPPLGSLKRFPNLKAILNLGAGVDGLLRDPDLPSGVPVVRMVDSDLATCMAEYVLLHVLRYHREQPALDAQQRAHQWQVIASPSAAHRRVGLMGLGAMGGAAAGLLTAVGFDVAAWTRSPRDMPGVACFHGDAGLTPFLAQSEILVCLLPLTAATTGILDRDLFANLPRGACLINAGRGGHQVEDDILAALDSGQLGGATLDVFGTEPLLTDSPFWDHPKVTLTPHNASIVNADSAIRHVCDSIRQVRAGAPLRHVVDPDTGY
ncbi:MAG: glyoxylate/hydroxypyruvate reductase A [Alphaproteobacteria bacterium]|nr:glyoxylate/hydroxypyruvate reductase A [Alphaproteobacteria bacterium]